MKEMYSADKAFTTCTVGFVTGSIQLERMEFLPRGARATHKDAV